MAPVWHLTYFTCQTTRRKLAQHMRPPHQYGTSLVLGNASFAYPAHASFDRTSNLVTPGPVAAADRDRCMTFVGGRSYPGSMEYIDVGDHISLSNDTVQVTLDRDPVFYPRPAGESWYVGYGASLMPVLRQARGEQLYLPEP